MTLRYVMPVLLATAAALFTACADDEVATPGTGQTTEPSKTVEVEMTIEDFSFAPAVISANLGDEISVELANDGEQEHTFTITELDVDETLESGQDADVTFVAGESGDFTYFCRNHPDEMQGSLRITAPGEAADDTTPTPDDDSDGGGFGY